MKTRMMIAFFLILVGFVAIAGRFVYLAGGNEVAVYTGVYGSRTLQVGINGARGVIYDRNGKVLVGGCEQAAVLCEPMSLSEQSAQYLREHAILISPAALDDAISTGRPFLAYVDEPIAGAGLTGLTALARYEGLAQSLIGYLDSQGHGVTGIEAIFDQALYNPDYSYSAVFQVDATRRALSGYGIAFEGSALPVKQGVVLSLDREIEQICEEVAKEQVDRGVILVSDITSGQICAWVSCPTFDPYDVTPYLESGDAMLNKPLSSYSCGSTFKILVAAAAMEAGLDLTREYECTGSFVAGEHVISCSKKDGHGKVDGATAFAHSCNPYFCYLASQVGGQALLEMAQRFGLGKSVDLGNGLTSDAGNLPKIEDLSSPAALANFAIGQGSLQVSPLQILQVGMIVANDGRRTDLRLFEGVVYEDGNRQVWEQQSREQTIISSDIARELKDWMVGSTHIGTGMPAASAVYDSAVKTSSAETGIYENGSQILHTWVTGFYPAQHPQYAITVLVEGGTSGYASAAPVFADIVNALYSCGLIQPVV